MTSATQSEDYMASRKVIPGGASRSGSSLLNRWHLVLMSLLLLALFAPLQAQTLNSVFPSTLIQTTEGSLSIYGANLRAPIDQTACGSPQASRVRVRFTTGGETVVSEAIIPLDDVVFGAVWAVPYTQQLTGQSGNYEVRVVYDNQPSPGVFQTCFTTNSVPLSVNFGILPQDLPLGFSDEAYGPVALQAGGGQGPITWSVLEGDLPQGLTLSTSGVISGTVTEPPGYYYFMVQALDSLGLLASRDFYITVAERIDIQPPTLPNAVIGQFYSQVISAPEAYEVYTEDALPPGLEILYDYNEESNDYVWKIEGTPNTVGTYPFLLIASALGEVQIPAYGERQYSITVESGIVVQTTSLPDATATVLYSTQLASNVPSGQANWQVSAGALPPGLTLNTGTGVISGAPLALGVYNFSVVVSTESQYGVLSSPPRALSITVGPFLLTVTTTALPSGTQNQAYAANLQFSGTTQPVTWSIVSGALPAGITLNTATGALSGIPTVIGTQNFSVRVQTSNGLAVSAPRALAISVGAPPVFVTTTVLPSGTQSQAYAATLQFSGTTGPVTWSIVSGTLPAGITLNTATGALSGIPTVIGTQNFSVRVQRSDGLAISEPRALAISVGAPPVFVTTAVLPSGTLSQAYAFNLQFSGTTEPVTWSIVSGTLPAGITLNTATGALSGIPTVLGTQNFSVRVQRSDGLATSEPRALAISVGPPPLLLAPESLSAGVVNSPYLVQLNPSGGVGNYVLAVASGNLPPGVTFDPGSRRLSGTPTQVGVFSFVVRLTSGGDLLEQGYTITIRPEPLRLLTEVLPDGYQGETYQVNLAAMGGVTPYAYSISAGTLPPGVALNPAGVIVGQPGGSGLFNLTVAVRDAEGETVSRPFALTIHPTLLLTGPSPLPLATQGESYAANLTSSGGRTPYSYSLAGGVLPQGITLTAAGAVTGTPSQSGEFVFTALVTDANGRTSQRAIELQVVGTLTLLPESLPEGTAFREYNLGLILQGGVGPYQWSHSGDLPPGILFENGVFRGAPTQIGTFPFEVTVRDSRERSLSRNYSITVAGGVLITTTALPPATAGDAYQATLAAEGGRAPYRWAVVGSLPEGLDLDPGLGLIAGSPGAGGTFNFTVRVEDQDGLSNTAALSIVVTMPPPPTLRITNLPVSSPPAQQPTFAVMLDEAYPLPLQGEVDLTFAPDRGPDDPAVQFANGSRRIPFTVPAGQRTANFTAPPALQTGTVAGLITLTSHYRAEGQDVTPTPPPTQTLRILPAAPVLTRLDLVRTATGFELVVFGYSTPREITRATVRLSPSFDGALAASEFTIDLNSIFTTWYNSTTSVPFGSQFRLSLPFNLTGNATDIGSAAVTLTNSLGTSNTLTTNF